ncbi:branched-chain amino acid transport system permease protein [Pseudochelatococcus lubricantis]|uniref:Branched-chain amino acid transport system permease protein n=1 Tax=Pseudochelatococcus lubricantis TaxID=1538102 RepID=A0ABX0UXM8_9HYPH|nr:high-affinity branched-chain amino acid ABC transporter permease LivM [Pseudochelatococcus lubricantis]NIJ57697.1 branched-chain amino acid transport system permease protein [Pseudochelatococcus lubricantis]
MSLAAARDTHDPEARSLFVAALREALVAGIIMVGLALPLVGFELENQTGGGVAIDYRFDWVAIAALVTFFGRFAVALSRPYVASALGRQKSVAGTPVRRTALPSGVTSAHLGLVLGLVALALPFLPIADRYIVDTATTVLIYVMLGLGLNIVVGLAGLLDLGYVAFYAVGAYSFALLSTIYGMSFWLCLPVAGIMAAFFGILLGFPVLRLRGDYLAIVTLGFGEIIRVVLINFDVLTGGPNGVGGIPRLTFFGHPFANRAQDGVTPFHELFGIAYAPIHRVIFLYYVIFVLVLITAFVSMRLRRLPIGRAWEALREDEIACRSLGLNVTRVKLSAFAIGAMFGGFAGTFFAARQGLVSPESFTFWESALVLMIVVLGGLGSQTGVVIAAIAVIAIPEFSRDLAQFRMLMFGAAMVALMVWRPGGIIGTRAPSVRLGGGVPSPSGKA